MRTAGLNMLLGLDRQVQEPLRSAAIARLKDVSELKLQVWCSVRLSCEGGGMLLLILFSILS